MRVWVVDDDPSFGTLVRHYLVGHDVEVFLQPEAVVTALQSQAPDVLLLDVHFRSGLASGHDLAAIAQDRGLPYVVCSDGEPFFGPPGTRRKSDLLVRNELAAALTAAVGEVACCA